MQQLLAAAAHRTRIRRTPPVVQLMPVHRMHRHVAEHRTVAVVVKSTVAADIARLSPE